MCIDVPRVEYKKIKHKEPGKVTKQDIEETMRIWNERKKKEAEDAVKNKK